MLILTRSFCALFLSLFFLISFYPSCRRAPLFPPSRNQPLRILPRSDPPKHQDSKRTSSNLLPFPSPLVEVFERLPLNAPSVLDHYSPSLASCRALPLLLKAPLQCSASQLHCTRRSCSSIMRYQSWDVLIFPERSKVPLQEFKTQCLVTRDHGKCLLYGIIPKAY